MQFQGLYSHKSAWYQILLLLLLILTGSILANIIGLGIFFISCGFSADIYQHVDYLRLYQFFSASGMFLLPALAMGWLCSSNLKQYLSIGKVPHPKALLYTIVAFLLIAPSINISETLNRMMTLPEFMAPIELWMKTQEETAQELTMLFLSQGGFLSLLSNLLVIAVLAGISEEFFFRGALQRIMEKWTTNPHLVIWVVAIIFSAIHLQFYGFIPRMLLGAFFGYLLLWSGNIWIPVFVHFLNNAIAVITLSSDVFKENGYITGELDSGELIPYSLLAVALLAIFFSLLKKIRQELSK